MVSPNKRRKALEFLEKGRQQYLAGDLDRAEKSFKTALKASPGDPDTLMMLGMLCIRTGRSDRAQQYLRPLLKTAPDDPHVLNNFGVACLMSGDADEGFDAVERASRLAPDDLGFRIDYAKALSARGRNEDALAEYEAAFAMTPNDLGLLINFGNALRVAGDINRACEVLERAFALNPEHPGVLNNLALTEEQAGNLERAATLFNKAAEISPDVGAYHSNLSATLRQLGRYEDAVRHGERAIGLLPDDPEVALRQAVLLLVLGRFQEGWAQYARRWDSAMVAGFPSLRGPRWDGDGLAGRTLLIRAEQSPGDQLVFTSCLGDLVERMTDGKVVLECEPRLVGAFSRTYPEFDVIPWVESSKPDFPPHDLCIPMGDLPSLLMRKTGDTGPRHPRRLIAEPDLRKHWADVFSSLGPEPKVGIAWRGGRTEVSKWKRSLDIETLLPILQTPGCQFVNLQYGNCQEDIDWVMKKHGIKIHHWPEINPLKELENQIAQIDAMDIVVQASNTSAHIAGALHKPLLVAQAFSPYWVWFVDSDDVPWYPYVRQFRATAPGQWDDVVARIKTALINSLSEMSSRHD